MYEGIILHSTMFYCHFIWYSVISVINAILWVTVNICEIIFCWVKCICTDGQLLVAVSNGNVHTPVQCYRVSVKKTDEKCIITSQALPSFFLQASPSDQHCKYVFAS